MRLPTTRAGGAELFLDSWLAGSNEQRRRHLSAKKYGARGRGGGARSFCSLGAGAAATLPSSAARAPALTCPPPPRLASSRHAGLKQAAGIYNPPPPPKSKPPSPKPPSPKPPPPSPKPKPPPPSPKPPPPSPPAPPLNCLDPTGSGAIIGGGNNIQLCPFAIAGAHRLRERASVLRALSLATHPPPLVWRSLPAPFPLTLPLPGTTCAAFNAGTDGAKAAISNSVANVLGIPPSLVIPVCATVCDKNGKNCKTIITVYVSAGGRGWVGVCVGGGWGMPRVACEMHVALHHASHPLLLPRPLPFTAQIDTSGLTPEEKQKLFDKVKNELGAINTAIEEALGNLPKPITVTDPIKGAQQNNAPPPPPAPKGQVVGDPHCK